MRTICIYNHKGGVGKTTTAVNLAAGLSRRDKKVLLIDLDPQGNIDVSLKLKAEHSLYDAMTGAISLKQCIINVATNFDIITSRETLAKAEYYLSNQNNARMLLKDLLGKITGYDYLIIDCPPSLGILNQNVLAFCKEIFIPVSTDYLGFDALQKMKAVIQKINENYNHHIQITRVIPTLYDRRNKICRETLTDIQTEYPKITSYPIRMNTKLKEAPKHGKSIFKYASSSIGARDYAQLVEDVIVMERMQIAAEAGF